jgi:hypothetical protein
LSPSLQTEVRKPTERDDRSSPVDPLADMEACSLAWCRACLYANPFVALGNAMLNGYIMSRVRRNRRG